jgi:outer membrane protein insertion porin family
MIVARLWHSWLLSLAIAMVGVCAAVLPAAPAFAQLAQFRVADVAVEGNVRVETEAILRRIQMPPGTMVGNREMGEAIRRVYELGFFDDIEVDATMTSDGALLVFLVREKPSIAAIRFEGNDALDDEDLMEDLGVRAEQILDRARVQDAEGRIEDAYREKGYYLVSVVSEIVPLSADAVEVIYRVTESDKVRVARVTFIGNESIPDSELLGFMETRPGTLLSFLTQFGSFKQTSFQTDLQRIRYLYYDQGFLDVSMGEPVVELSRDRSSLYITLSVIEGDQYSVSDVSVSGDMMTTQEDLMELVRLEASDVFRSSVVREDIDRISSLYRDAGYANANVNMLTRQDPDADTIGVQYDVDRGELCYIGRIEFLGNTTTRDRVMRRQMGIQEGDQYSGRGIRSSEAFLRQLGFFENVVIREEVDSENPRIIHLQIEVTERPTRSFQVGAGFSSVDSFIATAQISENNLLGRGQSLTLNAMLSAIRTMFVLSFVEPFLFDTRLQLGVDLFNRQLVLSNFERDSRGAALNLGYRPFFNSLFWRNFTVSLGYQIEDVTIVQGGRFGRVSSPLLTRQNGGLTSSITGGLALDRRDDRLFTRRGFFQAINVEIAESVLGSENEFFRARLISRWYHPVVNRSACPTSEESSGFGGFLCRYMSDVVGKLNIEIGYVGSTSPDRDVPIFERFFSGGPNSVRGFERLTLSPTAPVGQRQSPDSALRFINIGGHKEVIINAEIEFPLVNAIGIRGVLFADAGSSLAQDAPYTLRLDVMDPDAANTLRSALGFGFRWRSPIGPLRFEWGYPLAPRANERRSVFEFSIQNSF